MKPWDRNSKGTWAEARVKEWLEASSAALLGFAWHRYPDSKAARNYLVAQPSDFEIVWDGVPFKLEVKESGEKHRLPRSRIGQWAVLRKFWLAKARVIVLVYRTDLNHWVYYDGSDLFNWEEAPNSYVLGDRRVFSSAEEALTCATGREV